MQIILELRPRTRRAGLYEYGPRPEFVTQSCGSGRGIGIMSACTCRRRTGPDGKATWG